MWLKTIFESLLETMNFAQMLHCGTDVLANSQTIGFEIETFTKIQRIVGTSDGYFVGIVGGVIGYMKI